uniref:Uncharacterized protein n=1 Tax=Oryza sativa subsp. japonica TaxID=39947 RepID=Q5Z752_ORYSJ|nr:hypothetical protein [Oryza sativa Japonica Group]
MQVGPGHLASLHGGRRTVAGVDRRLGGQRRASALRLGGLRLATNGGGWPATSGGAATGVRRAAVGGGSVLLVFLFGGGGRVGRRLPPPPRLRFRSAPLARRLRRPHPPVRALRRGEIECRRILIPSAPLPTPSSPHPLRWRARQGQRARGGRGDPADDALLPLRRPPPMEKREGEVKRRGEEEADTWGPRGSHADSATDDRGQSAT